MITVITINTTTNRTTAELDTATVTPLATNAVNDNKITTTNSVTLAKSTEGIFDNTIVTY